MMTSPCSFILLSLLSASNAASVSLNATTIPHLGWISATFTLDVPATSGVFVTVHTPSSANVSAIKPQPYPAEAPWLATAAQKWILCGSIPGCEGKTVFSWNFSLVNSYADAVISVFEGGILAPRLLASSPAITFIDASAPSRGHLTRLPDPSTMMVTWWSPSDASTGAPRVRWGASPGALTFTSAPATAATYAAADLCGLPATGMGLQPAHFWLTANVTGLVPGAAAPVFYSFGDDVRGWSAPVAFVPPPAPGLAGGEVKMLLLADNGVTEPDGCVDHWDEPDASLTVEHLRELVADGGWSLVLHPGDVSYATGLLAKWPTYTARWAGVFDRVPYFVGQGNHERDFPGSGADPSYEGSLDSGGECGVVTGTIFPGSAGARALTHGPVHVAMLNSELPVSVGSAQYEWLNATLSALDRAQTPWSVVAFHRPLYYVSAGGAGGFRDAHFAPLEPLFVEHGVDAVLVGHVHNALVTCPVNAGVCTPGAPVHVCIGNAGQGLTPVQTAVPDWVRFQKSAFGFSTLVANATNMSIKLFADDGGAEWEEVTFSK